MIDSISFIVTGGVGTTYVSMIWSYKYDGLTRMSIALSFNISYHNISSVLHQTGGD